MSRCCPTSPTTRTCGGRPPQPWPTGGGGAPHRPSCGTAPAGEWSGRPPTRQAWTSPILRHAPQGSPELSDVAILGAGPYGLAAAVSLRGAGHTVTVLGEPMSFWERNMPRGMLLRSPHAGTNIGDPGGPFGL